MTSTWQREIDELVQPLRTTLAAFDEKVAELESELREVRESRRQVKRMLDLADGKGTPGPKKGTKPVSRGTPGMGDANATKLGEWIRTDPERWADGITARQAESAWQEHGIQRSVSAFNNYLNILTERGLLRLDRLDGNTKIYKLTQGGAASE